MEILPEHQEATIQVATMPRREHVRHARLLPPVERKLTRVAATIPAPLFVVPALLLLAVDGTLNALLEREYQSGL